jgi:hypothetical protein
VPAGFWERWNLYNTPQYRIFGIDADCHRIFDQAYRKAPHYLPMELPLPSSIQGFSLCDAQTRAPAATFYCFPYASAGRWQKKRLLRVTRPLLLPDKNREDETLISQVIKEMEDLGRRAGVYAIEAEVYNAIDSRIYFPSTSCAVNTYNTLEWKQILENKGFAFHEGRRCFKVKVDDFTDEHPLEEIKVRNYRPGDEQDQQRYYTLWTQSDDCPYDLGHSGFWYRNVFGWPRVWYSELSHFLNNEDYILFAEKKGEALGFLHWWPNIYPLLIKGGRKALYLSREEVEKNIQQINEAKIFKIVVTKKAKKDRDIIELALIIKAVKLMKERFGIRKCQIGNVSEKNTPLMSFIRERGGQTVQEVCLMRKMLLPWGR